MEIESLLKKNNNLKKIVLATMGIVLFILLAMTCFYMHKENVKKQKAIDEKIAKENATIEAMVKEKAVKNATTAGFDMQFTDEKTFCIEKDGVKYYFFIDASKVVIDRCEFLVETNVIVKKGNMEITITDLHNGNINVFYDDSRVVILDDGSEEGKYSTGYFICNEQFEDSSIEGGVIIDGEQKARDSHYTITQFITMEELKEQYNKALAICKQLNE